jgi:hypothetical protein
MATDQVSFLSTPADHVRSDRLTRRFDAQEMVPSASTSIGAAAIARGEESLTGSSNAFFAGPTVARFGAVALCARPS